MRSIPTRAACRVAGTNNKKKSFLFSRSSCRMCGGGVCSCARCFFARRWWRWKMSGAEEDFRGIACWHRLCFLESRQPGSPRPRRSGWMRAQKMRQHRCSRIRRLCCLNKAVGPSGPKNAENGQGLGSKQNLFLFSVQTFFGGFKRFFGTPCGSAGVGADRGGWGRRGGAHKILRSRAFAEP